MRHVGTNDRVGGAAYVVTAGNSEPAPFGELTLAIVPFRPGHHLLDAFGQPITLNPKSINSDTGRLQQISPAHLGRIQAQLLREFIELRFEGEADIYRTMSTHRPADRLVGENAIAVVLDIRDVVQRSE